MSELTEYWNKKKIVSRPYDPTGCPVPLGEGKCGETKGFEILMEFHKLYQDKISSIDVTAGGDSLQEKVDIQQDWINDLTEQNRLMARAIEELELEAIDKVQALEEKLLDYSKSLSEDEEKLNEKDRIIKELQESLATRTKTFDSAADISKETDKSNSLHEVSYQVCLNRTPSIIKNNENLIPADTNEMSVLQSNAKNCYKTKTLKNKQCQTIVSPREMEVPLCKNNCFLLNLFKEISGLRMHIGMKDKLLVQQVHIIETLASRLYVLEKFFKCLGVAEKALDDMVALSFSGNC